MPEERVLISAAMTLCRKLLRSVFKCDCEVGASVGDDVMKVTCHPEVGSHTHSGTPLDNHLQLQTKSDAKRYLEGGFSKSTSRHRS